MRHPCGCDSTVGHTDACLEASRAETREALARLASAEADEEARRQRLLDECAKHDAARSHMETATALISRAVDGGRFATGAYGELTEEMRAFLAGRGGSPTARPAATPTEKGGAR